MKNFLLITGGAGFVGSNLIEHLIKNTNKKIISLDNYSTGSKKNRLESKIEFVSRFRKNIRLDIQSNN